jgi:hypothetical protein
MKKTLILATIFFIILINDHACLNRRLSRSIRSSYLKNRPNDYQDNDYNFLEKNDISTSTFLNRASSKKKKKAPKSKVKEIEKLMYSQGSQKVKKNKDNNKIARIKEINKILKTHTWTMQKPERMQIKFKSLSSKHDPFMSYLGFLRDSSRRGYVNILENEAKRFYS